MITFILLAYGFIPDYLNHTANTVLIVEISVEAVVFAVLCGSLVVI